MLRELSGSTIKFTICHHVSNRITYNSSIRNKQSQNNLRRVRVAYTLHCITLYPLQNLPLLVGDQDHIHDSLGPSDPTTRIGIWIKV